MRVAVRAVDGRALVACGSGGVRRAEAYRGAAKRDALRNISAPTMRSVSPPAGGSGRAGYHGRTRRRDGEEDQRREDPHAGGNLRAVPWRSALNRRCRQSPPPRRPPRHDQVDDGRAFQRTRSADLCLRRQDGGRRFRLLAPPARTFLLRPRMSPHDAPKLWRQVVGEDRRLADEAGATHRVSSYSS